MIIVCMRNVNDRIGCNDGNAYLDLTDYANQSVNTDGSMVHVLLSTTVNKHELSSCFPPVQLELARIERER